MKIYGRDFSEEYIPVIRLADLLLERRLTDDELNDLISFLYDGFDDDYYTLALNAIAVTLNIDLDVKFSDGTKNDLHYEKLDKTLEELREVAKKMNEK